MQDLLRRSWIQVLVGALLLMAVIAVSGRPTVFTDTDDYYAQGRGAAHAIKPLVMPLLHPNDDYDDQDYLDAEADEDHTSMAARSPYYGILLYASNKVGGLWMLAAIQSLVAAWTLFALFRAVAPKAEFWAYPAMMAGLAAGSTLPYFTGFAMPDVFAPLGATATVTLCLFWDRLKVLSRMGLGLVAMASLWFHTSHILLELILMVLIAGVLWWFKAGYKSIAIRSAVILALVASAIGSDVAYHQVVLMRTGEELHRPPFLVARVLADGPGRIYLREACADGKSPYVLCRFKRDPLDNSDEILWADDPARGIFNASKVPVRIALEQEEKAFVLATILHHPWEQIQASLFNWGMQMTMIDLAEPLRDPVYYFTNIYWRDTSLPSLMPGGDVCMKHPRACRPNLTIEGLELVHGTVIALSLGFIGWRLTRRNLWKDLVQRQASTATSQNLLLGTVLILLLAIVANAAVTGILSGPFARYHARMVWLAPALAILLGVATGPGFDFASWAKRRLKQR